MIVVQYKGRPNELFFPVAFLSILAIAASMDSLFRPENISTFVPFLVPLLAGWIVKFTISRSDFISVYTNFRTSASDISRGKLLILIPEMFSPIYARLGSLLIFFAGFVISLSPSFFPPASSSSSGSSKVVGLNPM